MSNGALRPNTDTNMPVVVDVDSDLEVPREVLDRSNVGRSNSCSCPPPGVLSTIPTADEAVRWS